MPWATPIERLREDLSAERDRHLRTLADFKNYRRRIERDGNKLAKEGKRKILLALLDTIDDVEKAMHLWNNALLRPAQVRVAG